MTYTNDQRFQAIHPDGSDEWILRILSAQPRDSGIYECQVSTEPKISLPFRVNVVGKLFSIIILIFLYIIIYLVSTYATYNIFDIVMQNICYKYKMSSSSYLCLLYI